MTDPDDKWTNFAKIVFPLATAATKRNQTAQAKANRDWLITVAMADEIIKREAEQKKKANAVILAGKKRRNET
jgi:hypothetical protein